MLKKETILTAWRTHVRRMLTAGEFEKLHCQQHAFAMLVKKLTACNDKMYTVMQYKMTYLLGTALSCVLKVAEYKASVEQKGEELRTRYENKLRAQTIHRLQYIVRMQQTARAVTAS